MRKLAKSKKGSILDLFFMAILFAFLSIAVLVGSTVSGQFVDKVAESQAIADIAPEAITEAQESQGTYESSMDSMFLFGAIMLGIGSLILAALVRVHPIFIPGYIIVYIFLIFFCAILSNVYQKIAENPTMAETAANFTMMNGFLLIYPVIIGIFGIIMMVILYKQWSINQ